MLRISLASCLVLAACRHEPDDAANDANGDVCVTACDAPETVDATLSCGTRECGPNELWWSGLIWKVRYGTGGPGPNHWDTRNVFVDDQHRLHLSIAYRDGQWTTAELYTTAPLGFGRYEWFVDGALDQLDRNVVLGLFPYTTPAIGPDGTNEIDIEIARWGNATNNPLNYTVYPAVTGYTSTGTSLPMTLSGTYTTHRFEWRSDRIDFGSYHGFRADNLNPIGTWTYAPADYTVRIPHAAEPLHLNLWLFQGMPPANGMGTEIVLHEFHFTAL